MERAWISTSVMLFILTLPPHLARGDAATDAINQLATNPDSKCRDPRGCDAISTSSGNKSSAGSTLSSGAETGLFEKICADKDYQQKVIKRDVVAYSPVHRQNVTYQNGTISSPSQQLIHDSVMEMERVPVEFTKIADKFCKSRGVQAAFAKQAEVKSLQVSGQTNTCENLRTLHTKLTDLAGLITVPANDFLENIWPKIPEAIRPHKEKSAKDVREAVAAAAPGMQAKLQKGLEGDIQKVYGKLVPNSANERESVVDRYRALYLRDVNEALKKSMAISKHADSLQAPARALSCIL